MFGSKTRQLEEALEKRNAEFAELTARNEEMAAKLSGYRAKEDAIIGALTEAKTTAARIVAAAEKVRDDMLEDAEQSKKLAAKEAERVLNDARAHAEEVALAARQKAEDMLADVEADTKMYREMLAAFNTALCEAADGARAYAQKFEAFARGEILEDESVEIDYATAALRNQIEKEPVKLPEDYENPAALMRGIYSLQGRELPPVGSYGHAAEADEAYREDAEVSQETDFSREVVTDDAPEKDDAPAEHVWTVDEIINDAMAKTEGDIAVDAQLNALIDDVLKG